MLDLGFPVVVVVLGELERRRGQRYFLRADAKEPADAQQVSFDPAVLRDRISLTSPIFSSLVPVTSTPRRLGDQHLIGRLRRNGRSRAAHAAAARSRSVSSRSELELGGDEDCAMADDSINPLSAVVTNNFFSIGKPPCSGVLCVMATGAVFRFGLEKPALIQTTFECASLFRLDTLRAMPHTICESVMHARKNFSARNREKIF